MKKCSYCGKEYPDETTRCAVDAELLLPVGSQAPLPQSEETVATSYPLPDAVQAAARKNMLFGALWCGGGILVTALTYSAAASGPGDGSYVVAWGAIVFGALQFFRGVAGSATTGRRPGPAPPVQSELRVTTTPPKPQTSWRCSACGQELEPQFTSCWKCRTPCGDIVS